MIGFGKGTQVFPTSGDLFGNNSLPLRDILSPTVRDKHEELEARDVFCVLLPR